jgi:hypothetical protein
MKSLARRFGHPAAEPCRPKYGIRLMCVQLVQSAITDAEIMNRSSATLAVELLLTGTSIEEVAVLLGHSNNKVTQKHYNPWILKRQKLLESNVQRSWRGDPILLAMGTRRVRRGGAKSELIHNRRERSGAGGGNRTHGLGIASQELNTFGFKRFPMFQLSSNEQILE